MFVCWVDVRVCVVTYLLCDAVLSVFDVLCDAVWLLFVCLYVCVFV